jgi:Fur family peroxide stress response transcriptional regulator
VGRAPAAARSRTNGEAAKAVRAAPARAGWGSGLPVTAAQLEAFAAHCKAHGLSVTQQRLAIFEALAGSRAHPSAEQIHLAVRRKHPALSLATVYKNLEALRAVGAVSDVNPLHVEARYEAALPGTGAGAPHHHLVCTSCHKVCDLPAWLVPAPALSLEQTMGFQVHGLRVQVEGLCPDCREH